MEKILEALKSLWDTIDSRLATIEAALVPFLHQDGPTIAQRLVY